MEFVKNISCYVMHKLLDIGQTLTNNHRLTNNHLLTNNSKSKSKKEGAETHRIWMESAKRVRTKQNLYKPDSRSRCGGVTISPAVDAPSIPS